MLKAITKILAVLLTVVALQGCFNSNSLNNKELNWVGTWSTAPQLVEPHNMPPEPGLSSNTLRQIVRVSIGGDIVRLHFSNIFGTSPVEIKTAAIAKSTNKGLIEIESQEVLKFNNKNDAVIAPGEELFSDPIKFDLQPGSLLAITIHFGNTSHDITGHPGSRTTSYILSGNQMSSHDFASSIETDHWYIINGIEVNAQEHSSAIAVLGNSITDGRGSGTNKQNRWTDILSERLLQDEETKNIGVLNMGIGGNCVLRGGLGPTGIDRFDRDILSRNGVRWVIILEGINDIGAIEKAEDAEKTSHELIAAYKEMIAKAHEQGLFVYGATILPFAKSFYDNDFRQAARDIVNDWIRNSGYFDGVIDFDRIMRNPEDTVVIQTDLHDGDFLHPNELGYKTMGEYIDLNLFK